MDTNEILVVYGDSPYDMAIQIAEAANLADLIGDRSKRIGLKPNLVVSRPAREGATTHPEIAAGLIAYLHKHGFTNIVILEGAWVGDSTTRAFKVCGYSTLAQQTGVALFDTQKDSYETVDCGGMQIEICSIVKTIDFMINLPVLKGHCQTRLTCALKNHKGLIPDREKRRFHTLGLYKPIAHMNIATPSDFIVVDGMCGDLDFEEGGTPLYGGRLFAARDPVLCDAWAAQLIGYHPDTIPYIGLAEQLGLGSSGPAAIRELNSNAAAQAAQAPRPQGKVQQLAQCIREDGACSACYASLVYALSRLDRNERQVLGTVCIGQGFQGKQGKIGAGRCTASFEAFCPGCPPTGIELLEFFRSML